MGNKTKTETERYDILRSNDVLFLNPQPGHQLWGQRDDCVEVHQLFQR